MLELGCGTNQNSMGTTELAMSVAMDLLGPTEAHEDNTFIRQLSVYSHDATPYSFVLLVFDRWQQPQQWKWCFGRR
jgi:hypothetical protein